MDRQGAGHVQYVPNVIRAPSAPVGRAEETAIISIIIFSSAILPECKQLNIAPIRLFLWKRFMPS